MMIPGYRINASDATTERHRAVHLASSRRVVIELRGAEDWRTHAVAMLRATGIVNALGQTCGHRGVARLVDHGVLADLQPWLATEVPDGIPLSEIMLRRELAADEVATLVRDVTELLAHAHKRDVVHCRIRPESLYFGTGPRHAPIIVGDWGGLRAPGVVAADEPTDLSAYCAPELFGRCDGRADIYSLGVIAYHAFTGRFPDADPTHVIGAPAALSTLLCRMLAVDPERRPTAVEANWFAQRILAPATPRIRWTPATGVPALNVVEARKQIAKLRQ